MSTTDALPDGRKTLTLKQVSDIMRHFKNTKKVKALLQATEKLIDSLDFYEKLPQTIFCFLTWAIESDEPVRSRSTGRQHVIKSTESEYLFGEAMVKKLTILLYKFTSHMQGIRLLQ